MSWFKCGHPAKLIAVEKEQTTEQQDCEFEIVTYHMKCLRCDAPLKFLHGRIIDGVTVFLDRAPKT